MTDITAPGVLPVEIQEPSGADEFHKFPRWAVYVEFAAELPFGEFGAGSDFRSPIYNMSWDPFNPHWAWGRPSPSDVAFAVVRRIGQILDSDPDPIVWPVANGSLPNRQGWCPVFHRRTDENHHLTGTGYATMGFAALDLVDPDDVFERMVTTARQAKRDIAEALSRPLSARQGVERSRIG
ncbi:hypothetical protein DEU38_1394 [Rhodococcus sp. AG1013]|uniref:hypothetical protein n=1 Tax=Rhodococcus sp. AG1013 TaxID=2183996 RepID=UPI000E09FBDF|nr:hypothetical protein [Rhodococcus sp. AG1013]RDI12035.1 hypothetical protein DEU38_1394 [Rhodococcus sp. AG1013]